MIAGISEDTGLEAHLITPKSVTQVDFVEFIEKISQKYQGKNLYLFMDNLAVHKTSDVMEIY
jgi:DDE superfamily endonuclease